MRIALFSSFSPETGGGSVQLRSHLEYLRELNVQWFYLAERPISREDCHWLGKPFNGLQLYSDFAARAGFLPGSRRRAGQIAASLGADLYWVVGHYEGISVADELLRAGKPVHLTIHDEPLAMLIRSRRYRPLWPLLRPTFARVLRGAQSVDVTSTKMRDYLNPKYGAHCFALYKYLPALPRMTAHLPGETLRIGHIGSLYQAAPFRQFVLACREFAALLHRPVTIVRIGTSPQMDEVAAENRVSFENHGEIPEHQAVAILATCDFAYSMYPRGFRFQGFRRNSLPIKLSTYIQAQRPIFAHTPLDSGLAELVSKFNVGLVCSCDRPEAIRDCLGQFWQMKVQRQAFEDLRNVLMGREQLEQLRQALTRGSAKAASLA